MRILPAVEAVRRRWHHCIVMNNSTKNHRLLLDKASVHLLSKNTVHVEDFQNNKNWTVNAILAAI